MSLLHLSVSTNTEDQCRIVHVYCRPSADTPSYARLCCLDEKYFTLTAPANPIAKRPMKSVNLLMVLGTHPASNSWLQGIRVCGNPTTDGFHSKLPSPYTRAVVWGGRADTIQSASTWLLKKGILVVDQTKVLQAAADQKVSLTGYQYLKQTCCEWLN